MGSKEQSRYVMNEVLRNLCLQALKNNNLTVELNFAEMLRMTKEIDRLCNRKTFEYKKAIEQAVDFVEDKVKNTVTDIIPQFQDFFENLTDRLKSSTISSIKEDKKLGFPISYYKLPHMPENEHELREKREEDIKDFLTLFLNSYEQDLKVAAKLDAEQTRNLYVSATDTNPDLEIDDVPNNNDYYYDNELD